MNQRATRPNERLPTTICCASLPICNSADVPEARTEVIFKRSGSKSMPSLACSTQERSSSAISWRTCAQDSSLSGSSEFVSHECVQPNTALMLCPVSEASRMAHFKAANDSSEPSTPTTMSARGVVALVAVAVVSSTMGCLLQRHGSQRHHRRTCFKHTV